MLTPEQQTAIFADTVPRIADDLVLKGLDRSSADAVAVDMVLSYIVELQDDPHIGLSKHSYGIKIGPGKGTINLFLTFDLKAPSV